MEQNSGSGNMVNVHQKVKLMVTIVDRGEGNRVIELCKKEYVTYHLLLMGWGTAKSEILDYLGLGETEKDIVLSVVAEDIFPGIWEMLKKEMDFGAPGNGIAFSIPVSSVGGPMTLKFISGLFDRLYRGIAADKGKDPA
jgi:hypothetical protein